jgi:hypothetical protein
MHSGPYSYCNSNRNRSRSPGRRPALLSIWLEPGLPTGCRYPCCACNKPFGQAVPGSIGALAADQGVNYELLTRGAAQPASRQPVTRRPRRPPAGRGGAGHPTTVCPRSCPSAGGIAPCAILLWGAVLYCCFGAIIATAGGLHRATTGELSTGGLSHLLLLLVAVAATMVSGSDALAS